MKRIAPVLVILILSTTAFAQKLTVVVGAVGVDPKPGLLKNLETQVKAAFVKDGRYTAVTREEAVLGAVGNEQAHQRTGAVDDSQIRQLGKQTGARYVCVVEITPLMNSYTLSAQFVDIVSANIVNIASVPSQLRNSGDFLAASEELVRKLLGYAETPASAQKATTKYIAVLETQIDTQSITAKDISGADLREITSALRREAVKNLPRDRYNVMTSETVQSMGTAMLKDCVGENCIITIGSKIGADYIVRGTLSRAGGKLSLTVEIFETEYGNLVAVTPAPVRTADINELFYESSLGSAAMYRSFAGTSTRTLPRAFAYALTAAAKPAAGGTVSRAPDRMRYDSDMRVAVTARPAAGYVFAGWSGAPMGVDASAASIAFNINSDVMLTANFFRPSDYTLTVNSNPHEATGAVSYKYPAGESFYITASHVPGYTFIGWSGASTAITPKIMLTMNRDMTLTANYKANIVPPHKTVTDTRFSHPESAAIFIATLPSHADIYIGEKLVGTANSGELRIPPGTHQVRLVKNNLEKTMSITVQPGKNPTLFIPLKQRDSRKHPDLVSDGDNRNHPGFVSGYDGDLFALFSTSSDIESFSTFALKFAKFFNSEDFNKFGLRLKAGINQYQEIIQTRWGPTQEEMFIEIFGDLQPVYRAGSFDKHIEAALGAGYGSEGGFRLMLSAAGRYKFLALEFEQSLIYGMDITRLKFSFPITSKRPVNPKTGSTRVIEYIPAIVPSWCNGKYSTVFAFDMNWYKFKGSGGVSKPMEMFDNDIRNNFGSDDWGSDDW